MSKAPICSCGLSMVERRNKVTSQLFYGCVKFGSGGCGDTEHKDEEFTCDEYGNDRDPGGPFGLYNDL